MNVCFLFILGKRVGKQMKVVLMTCDSRCRLLTLLQPRHFAPSFTTGSRNSKSHDQVEISLASAMHECGRCLSWNIIRKLTCAHDFQLFDRSFPAEINLTAKSSERFYYAGSDALYVSFFFYTDIVRFELGPAHRKRTGTLVHRHE